MATPTRDVPELPALLAKGGLIDQRLDRAEGAVHPLGCEARELLCSLRVSAEHLRRHLSYPQFLSDPATTQSRYSAGLAEACRQGLDRVLCYLLALATGQTKTAEHLEDEAGNAYTRAATAYDAFLGDLIPPDFRAACQQQHAEWLYEQGGHVCAADDWDIFLRRRARRADDALRGLQTGLGPFDQALSGLRGFTIVAGPPGVGKSALAMDLALGALRHRADLALLVLSLDMPKEAIFDRWLGQVTAQPAPRKESPAERLERYRQATALEE